MANETVSIAFSMSVGQWARWLKAIQHELGSETPDDPSSAVVGFCVHRLGQLLDSIEADEARRGRLAKKANLRAEVVL